MQELRNVAIDEPENADEGVHPVSFILAQFADKFPAIFLSIFFPCGIIFQIPPLTKRSGKQTLHSPFPNTTMNFACPTCHITLQADDEHAGRTVKCPGCSTRLQIPANFPEHEDDGVADGETDPLHDHLPPLNSATGHLGPHPSTVNVWVAGGIGLVSTLVWYIFMLFLPARKVAGADEGWGVYLRDLFCERGTTQYVTMVLSFWCIGLLVLKWLNLRKQRHAMMIQALPNDISEEINLSNLKQFHDHLITFPRPLRNTYMVNRVRKALEFFYVRRNNPETATMISSLSEVDAAKANGSYGIVKVFLWAIPIMGFIGTVVGIGAAIGGFGAVFGAGEGGDMSQIKEPLLNVLSSMAVAFDTTLLALVVSIILSFPSSSLQGQEDDLVSDVDEYCVDHLLKRLNDGGGSAGDSGAAADPAALRAIGDALAKSQKDMLDRFEHVQKGMTENLGNQTKQHEKVAAAIEKQMEAIDQRTEKYEKKLDRSLDAQVASLAEGIRNLNAVLKDLNGKQVVVQKKGWFSRN